jgi:hypothetical protein
MTILRTVIYALLFCLGSCAKKNTGINTANAVTVWPATYSALIWAQDSVQVLVEKIKEGSPYLCAHDEGLPE